QFAFSISWPGVDPKSAVSVVFIGPESQEKQTPAELDPIKPNVVSGKATLAAGRYRLATTNGGKPVPNPFYVVVAPQLSDLLISSRPVMPNVPFDFAIMGSGFDPAKVQLYLADTPKCQPRCALKATNISTSSDKLLIGTLMLPEEGNMSIAVSNEGEAFSNTAQLTVRKLEIREVHPDTPPVPMVPFHFEIRGTGFDPANSEILFACPPRWCAHHELRLVDPRRCVARDGSGREVPQVCNPIQLDIDRSASTSNLLAGKMTVPTSAGLKIVVRNKPNDPPNMFSSPKDLKIEEPLITKVFWITPPGPSVSGSELGIVGKGFDPAAVQVLVKGRAPGIAPRDLPSKVSSDPKTPNFLKVQMQGQINEKVEIQLN